MYTPSDHTSVLRSIPSFLVKSAGGTDMISDSAVSQSSVSPPAWPRSLRELEGPLPDPVSNFLSLRRNTIVILEDNQFRNQISLLFSSDFPLDNAIRNRIT